MLERIESTMAAIKTKLLRNDTLRKLLYCDTPDALECEAPKAKEVNKYITLKPVYEFENKEDYNQSSMINIYTTQIDPADEGRYTASVIQINVVCNTDVWELDDSKIRPLRICEEVIRMVDKAKFSASNKLELATITDLIISKKMFGYALLFDLVDGSGEIDKF